MHLPALIQDLAVILAVASLVSLICQKIKQPVVLGYLIAGIIVGPFTPPFSLVLDIAGIKIWAELGVIFLMFSLGLEFSFRRLLKVGKTAAVTGPFEVVFMLALGFLSGRIAGFSAIDSVFLGAILSISSTTIIIKSLDELKLTKEKFAELIYGILIVEDLVGILVLVVLSTMGDGNAFSLATLFWAAVKLVVVVLSWIVIGSLTIPRLISHVSKKSNDETLTIVSLGLCLLLVVLSVKFHYSAALGAFIMGSIMGESSQVHRIEKLIRPLRDVFGAIFFVSIGMLLNPSDIATHWGAILVLTALTIVGKIVCTTLGARLTGQSLRTSVQVGFGLAQIGEFSFIIASLGLDLKIMSPFLYPVAVCVSIATTFTTPYLIRASLPVSDYLESRAKPKGRKR